MPRASPDPSPLARLDLRAGRKVSFSGGFKSGIRAGQPTTEDRSLYDDDSLLHDLEGITSDSRGYIDLADHHGFNIRGDRFVRQDSHRKISGWPVE